MGDNIKHPSHYAEGRKFEPKDVIRDWGLNFNLGSAVKYVARAGRKDDIIQDLKKAQEFIQFEIEAIEAERAKVVKPHKAPNCKHSVKPVRTRAGIFELDVPEDATPEEIIHEVVKKLCEAEE